MATSSAEFAKRVEAREAVLDAIIKAAPTSSADSLAKLAEAYKAIVSPTSPG